MAYVIKEAESKPAITTDTTLYQVTAAKDFVVAALRIVNMGAADEVVKIAVSATATPDADEWIFRATIKPLKPVQLSGDLVSGGKFIVVHNETDANVIFKLTGYEST